MNPPSTELVAWDTAVARIRANEARSFEARMDSAIASFDVIGDAGVDAQGRKLADLALAAEVSYGTLANWRSQWQFLGDLHYVMKIGVYSILVEGMRAKRWANGAELAGFLATTQPPDGFKTWTLDAFRASLGQKSATSRRPKRPLPKDLHEVDSWTDYLIKRPELAEHALMRLDEKLYPAEKPTAPVPTTRKVDVARRCEGLLRKALSTTPEEAHAALMKVRDLLATYDLVADFKIGER